MCRRPCEESISSEEFYRSYERMRALEGRYQITFDANVHRGQGSFGVFGD